MSIQTDQTTTATPDASTRVSRLIPAARDLVYAAWTQPEHVRRWASPEGTTVAEADVDLRVGGKFRIHMAAPEGQFYTAFGTYREIDAPSRLVYTWDWEQAEQAVGETIVTVEFLDRDGGTEVVVTHERFPNAEAAEGHEQGWTSCLGRLEELVAGV